MSLPPDPDAIDFPRPVLRQGDTGPAVSYLQALLPHGFDGDFGPITDQEVRDYQRTHGLAIDGVVGPATWAALESGAPPVRPPPPPHAFDPGQQVAIMDIANGSAIATYSWQDRGTAPQGFTQGIALAFAQSYRKLLAGHPAAVEMAKANTGDDDVDALSWYESDFSALGMSNEIAGRDTLRHLYVLLMGLGMRESSGQHCEGRDMSADNVSSDTAEAGLYQTSYNAHACDPAFDDLMDEYSNPANRATCYLEAFAVDVECSADDWENYGSGDGCEFQQLCKECPAFAVETCGLVLRNLRQHYGPINRKEAELRDDADQMFRMVQDYVDRIDAAVA